MRLEDWKDIHYKDSFEKLLNDVLTDEIYFLKCDARDYGYYWANHNQECTDYAKRTIEDRVQRLNWIRERLMELR